MKNILRFFIIAILILNCIKAFPAIPENNCNFYVADNGSDNIDPNTVNTCDNYSTPCLTIQHALTFVNSDNFTICLIPDNDSTTYFIGNVTISKQVIIKKIDNATTLPVLITDNSSDKYPALTIKSDNVTIDSLEIKQQDNDEEAIVFNGSHDNITIKNCQMGSDSNPFIIINYGVIYGQSDINLSRILFDNITIYGNTRSLIFFSALNIDNLTIQRSKFFHYNPTQVGIKINLGKNIRFLNNYISGTVLVDGNNINILFDKNHFDNCSNYPGNKGCINFSTGLFDNISIENNYFNADGADNGIFFGGDAINIRIVNNIIKNASGAGGDSTGAGIMFVWNQNEDNLTIDNNTIYNNQCTNIYISGTSNNNIVIRNNNLKNTSPNSVGPYGTNDCGNIFITNSKNVLIYNNEFDNISDNYTQGHLKISGSSDFITIASNKFYQTGGTGGKSIIFEAYTNKRNIFVVENKIFSDNDTKNQMFIQSNGSVFFLNDIYPSILTPPSSDVDNEWNSPTKLSYFYLFQPDNRSWIKEKVGNYYGFDTNRSDYENNGLDDLPEIIDVDDNDTAPLFTSIDNYSLNIWWLTDFQDNDNTSIKHMLFSNTDSPINEVTIDAGDNVIWIDNNSDNMTFTSGDINDNTSWTGHLFISQPQNGNITLEIGKYYPDNKTFESIINGNININADFRRYPFALEGNEFSTDNNSYLAFRIINNTGDTIKILTGGAFTFISAPVKKYTVKVTISGDLYGSVASSPEGICLSSGTYCSSQVDNYSYFYNTRVEIDGIPDSGYDFYWSSGCDNTSNMACIVYLDQDNKSVIGYFSQAQGGSYEYTNGGGESQNNNTYNPPVTENTLTDNTINEVSDSINQILESEITENTVDEINDVMDTTTDLIDQISTPDQAIKVIDNINKIVEASVKIIESGQTLDVDKLKNVIQSISKVNDILLKSNDIAKLKQVADIAGQMSTEVAKIIEQSKNIDDIKKLAETAKNIADAGLKSAIAGEVQPDKVGQVLDSTIQVLEKAVEQGKVITQKTEDLVSVIKNSGEITGKVFQKVSELKDTANDKVKEILITKTQQKAIDVTNKVVDTIQKIDPKLITPTNAKDIKQGLSDLSSSMVKVINNGLSEDVIKDFQNAATNLVDKVKDDIPLNAENVAKVINFTAINLTNGLLKQPQLENTNIESILPQVIPITNPIININGTTIKISDIVENTLNQIGNVGGINVNSQTLVNQIKFNNKEFSTFISDVAIASGIIKDNIFQDNDGTIYINLEGVLQKISPAPIDPVAVAETLLESFSGANNFSQTGDNSTKVKINRDGTIVTQVGDTKIYGTFSYEVENTNSYSIGTVSFSMPVSNPTLSTYSVLVHYEDGSQQAIYPYINDFDKLREILDASPDIIYNFDRNSGILTVKINQNEYRYKVDFSVKPMTVVERLWYENNKTANGLAFRVDDFNNDGITDVKYYTENGVQIFYGIK